MNDRRVIMASNVPSALVTNNGVKVKVKDAGNPWVAIVFLAVVPAMIPINIILWKIAVGH